MILSSLKLLILRELHFEEYSFSRWKSVVAVTVLGVLYGSDADITTSFFENLPPDIQISSDDFSPYHFSLPFGIAFIWLDFLVTFGVLYLWMKLGKCWSGKGSLFNLIATAQLMISILILALAPIALIPWPVSVVLSIYGIWIFANALSGAIPNASMVWCVIGTVIAGTLGVAVSVIVVGATSATILMLTGIIVT